MPAKYFAFIVLSFAFLSTAARADYIYTVDFNATSVTNTTSFQFTNPTLFRGIMSPQVDLVSPPFAGAVVLSNVDTFRIDATNGALVITIGTLRPLNVYQFTATFNPLTAVGNYPFSTADVSNFHTGASESTTGSISIVQSLGLPTPIPEPATTLLSALGLFVLVPLCKTRGRYALRFLKSSSRPIICE
jgi:hypothetical protein